MYRNARFWLTGCAVLFMVILSPLNSLSANRPALHQVDATSAGTNTCDCGIWGDVTGDGQINPMDAVYMLNFIYRGIDNLVQPLSCPSAAGDINCDAVVTPLDLTIFINIIYRGNGIGSCGNPCTGTSGEVTAWSGCKPGTLGKTTTPASSDQECIQYDYDGLGTLLLKHVNAGFNCGTNTVISEITVGIGSITIEEDEEGTPAFCLCLFDVDYTISDLPPGVYTIGVNGLYLDDGDQPLIFVVDLTSATSGEFCVTRTHYPWGM